MRKQYLDNIRWAVVILVFLYHVCYLFNGIGILGGIPEAESIPFFDGAMLVVYPWFMVLLFVIAGMSARYSLEKRTAGQFLKERAEKLLAPSTLGLFVLHWITGYLNIKMGGGLSYIPSFLVYPIAVISGSGPLWFIQMLFFFSCILLLLRKADPGDRLWRACHSAGAVVLLLCFFLIWGAAQVLNAPVITVYRFGIYFAAFCIGYYVFSHEKAQAAAEKIRFPMLAVSLAGAVLCLFLYGGTNFTEPECLQSFAVNLYLWAAVLAVIGWGRKYGGGTGRFAAYMKKAGFGVYILHYPVLTVVCYFLRYPGGFPAAVNYLIAAAGGFALTLILYEILRRIPVIRFLVLGQRGEKANPRRKIGKQEKAEGENQHKQPKKGL